jgi:Ca2+-binding EF-hand superfamily protein
VLCIACGYNLTDQRIK